MALRRKVGMDTFSPVTGGKDLWSLDPDPPRRSCNSRSSNNQPSFTAKHFSDWLLDLHDAWAITHFRFVRKT